ncbi:MAG: CDP-glycerol glycerophosphotransferase family protein, partial [Clostridia bacterium]|nr:CDP-glycerol glycerophosphotransferase family protein [Clostridia bacterium]
FVKDSEYVRRCKELIKDMSTAGYIFMDEATHITAKIKLRPETQMVQLWHGCGAFKKFGYSVTDGKFGASQRAKTRYPVHTNYTLATVSSPEVITHFEDAMNLKGKNTVKATGVSRTDIFYNEVFIKDAHSKLYRLFPEAKNKKVILYAPTFRGNVENALAPDKLDLSLLNESLSDEYVLILKHHPLVRTKPEIPSELKKTFAADLSDEMSVDELLCVSDICISDYSSLIFEYSIFSKPMIFFAYDLKEYFDSRGFYYDYDAFTPGPVFSHTSEICEYIRNISSNFDETVITQFREKFMRSCDGKATKRIIGEVFGSNYSEHLKQ